VLQILIKNSARLKIAPIPLFVIKNALGTLDGIIARGTITPDERTLVIQAARVVLFTVL
jgi:hypothetical protein